MIAAMGARGLCHLGSPGNTHRHCASTKGARATPILNATPQRERWQHPSTLRLHKESAGNTHPHCASTMLARATPINTAPPQREREQHLSSLRLHKGSAGNTHPHCASTKGALATPIHTAPPQWERWQQTSTLRLHKVSAGNMHPHSASTKGALATPIHTACASTKGALATPIHTAPPQSQRWQHASTLRLHKVSAGNTYPHSAFEVHHNALCRPADGARGQCCQETIVLSIDQLTGPSGSAAKRPLCSLSTS